MKAVDVIFVSNYTETARDLLLVGGGLRARGFQVEFCVGNTDTRLVRLIREAEFPVFHLFEPSQELSSQESPSSDKGLSPTIRGSWKGRLFGKWVAAGGLGAFLGELRNQRRYWNAAVRMLEKKQPRAIVLDCDSVPPSLQIATAGQRNDLPLAVIQSGILSTPEFIAKRNLNLQKTSPSRCPVFRRICKAVVRKRWPQFVQHVESQDVLNTFGPYPIIAGGVFGILPSSNWLQFGGPSNCCVVAGERARRVLEEYGIDPDTIYVYGQPRMDRAVRIGNNSVQIHDSCDTAETRIVGGLTRILIATAPWERYGVCSVETKIGWIESIVEAFSKQWQVGQVELIIKVHPLEPHEHYGDVVERFPVCRVVHGGDIIDLIRECDIFVTQVSTAAHFAIAARRPVVTYNFDERPIFDLLYKNGLSMRVSTPDELVGVVGRLLVPDEAAAVCHTQRRNLKDLSVLSGHTTNDIVELLQGMLSESKVMRMGKEFRDVC